MYDIRNMNIWKKEPESKRPIDELFDVEISELNLSVRSYNCLKRAGCDTVGAILTLLDEDEGGLRKIRYLGSRSEQEILECVQKFKEEAELRGNDRPKKKTLLKPAKCAE